MKVSINNVEFDAKRVYKRNQFFHQIMKFLGRRPSTAVDSSVVVKKWHLSSKDPVEKSHLFHKHPFLCQWEKRISFDGKSKLYGVYGSTVDVVWVVR